MKLSIMKNEPLTLLSILFMFMFLLSCDKNNTFVDNGNLAMISTNEVSNIGPASAVSGGHITAQGSSAITARGVVWATSENLTVFLNDGISHDGDGQGSFESLIAGLESQTQYFVRAYATNASGTAYGQTRSFTTSDMHDELTDADGNTYAVVNIGGNLWMAENLRTTKYNDGSEIQHITGEDAWTNADTGAYAWYENNEGNAATYGALYNWRAVETRKLCPVGWHVATDDDWKHLEGTVDSQYGVGDAEWEGISYRGNDAGDKLKASSGWSGSGYTNEYGFSALPGGTRGLAGPFYLMGLSGAWWTGTFEADDMAWTRSIASSGSRVRRASAPLNNGQYIRCVMSN